MNQYSHYLQGWAMRLTILRVLLIPIFMFTFYFYPESLGKWLCLWVYIIASLSDFFDGFLARYMKEESAFGAFLDPVADKLMVTAVLIIVLQSRPEIWLMLCAIIIIGREIWISALRELMSGMGNSRIVAVSKLAKWKTTAQMFAMGFLIYQDDWLGLPIWQIGKILMIIAAILTLITMWQYSIAAYRYFNQIKTTK